MILLDANTSTLDTGNSGTVTSSAFSTTNPNQLLLAFTATESNGSAVSTLTGAGLIWHKVVSQNVAAFSSIEIWRTFAPAILTGQTVTVTWNFSSNTFLNVVSFSGANTSGVDGAGAIGATGSQSTSSAAPSVTVTTTKPNSWIWAASVDGGINSTPTIGTGQVLNVRVADSTVSAFWTQYRILRSPDSTAVISNDTAPTTSNLNFVVAEILPYEASFKLPNKGLRPHPFSPGLAR